MDKVSPRPMTPAPPSAAGSPSAAPLPQRLLLQQLAVDGAWRQVGDCRLLNISPALAAALGQPPSGQPPSAPSMTGGEAAADAPLPQPATADRLRDALSDPQQPVILLRATAPLPLSLIETLATRSPLPKTLLIEDASL